MAKRQINFTGPSVQDLGLEISNGASENAVTGNSVTQDGITQNGNGNIGITQKFNEAAKSQCLKSRASVEPEITSTDIGIANIGNTKFTNSTNGNAKRTYNTVHLKLIRDYLYAALGSDDRAEIKLSVMGQDLSINPKTLYKHLKILRETEFFITKLQYGTEIRRR